MKVIHRRLSNFPKSRKCKDSHHGISMNKPLMKKWTIVSFTSAVIAQIIFTPHKNTVLTFLFYVNQNIKLYNDMPFLVTTENISSDDIFQTHFVQNWSSWLNISFAVSRFVKTFSRIFNNFRECMNFYKSICESRKFMNLGPAHLVYSRKVSSCGLSRKRAPERFRSF